MAVLEELGEEPEALTLDFQTKSDDVYAEMVERSAPDNFVDYEAMLEEFAQVGQASELGGLRNGLSEAENRRLFKTDDVDEMVTLVLRGLINLASG